ncbi:MAG: hypothetical protein ACKO23_16850 [Gemmataceae bacterium]
MALKFPNLDTLRMALVAGAVPPAIAGESLAYCLDDQGQYWVDSSGTLSRTNHAELKKLGVATVKNLPAIDKQELTCWAELLPLERTQLEPLAPQLPVLFDLPSSEEMVRLAMEVLRLGNDRQGYRWLQEGENSGRALLRIVGPPYYSLLRAVDQMGGAQAPVAYLERAPRIWVELGHTHPLLPLLKAPEGKVLLLRPPRQWVYLDDLPFHDIYENLEFNLPSSKVSWKDQPLEKKLPVRPILRSGGSSDSPELWVLQKNAIEGLNAFVQNADDQLLQRLSFAVAQKNGKRMVLLRARHSRQSPPVVVLNDAVAYVNYLKLPNLFLPVGKRLHPPLRRDQVRQLLADDPARIVWLQPGDDEAFSPMSLPEDAFRPLSDWVEYVLDHEKEALQSWIQSFTFDFEGFVSEEESSAKPPKPPAATPKTKPRVERTASRDTPGSETAFTPKAESDGKASGPPPLDDFGQVAKQDLNELQQRLRTLEESFLSLEGGLDNPQRQEMWLTLASLNSRLQNVEDAGLAWMNVLWENDSPDPSWIQNWFAIEASAVPSRQESSRSQPRSWVSRITGGSGKSRELTAEDFDRLLGQEEPTSADLRALVAYLMLASTQPQPPAALVGRLAAIGRFLEANEKLLPVRAVWLAWYHYTQLSRGDVLSLARARDRLLERLFQAGIRPELDLPSFLRFAEQPTSQRFRAVRQWLAGLAEKAREWQKAQPHSGFYPEKLPQTPAYIDLIFAFGLARLGESDLARKLLARGRSVLESRDDVHRFLLRCYEFRIRQAMEGKGHAGPLPDELLHQLNQWDPTGGRERAAGNDLQGPRWYRYTVDFLRKQSQILEPDQRINPYSNLTRKNIRDELSRQLVEISELTDREEIARRFDRLLAEHPRANKADDVRLVIVQAGLEASPRVHEDFARRMLAQVVPVYDQIPMKGDGVPLQAQTAFLERAMFVAGHFGRLEMIGPLVARFLKIIQIQENGQALKLLDDLGMTSSSFRALRKLGMRDEIDRILHQISVMVLQGEDLKTMDFKKYPNNQGPAALRALLQVAAGWYFFGRDAQAEPILQTARTVLLSNELNYREQTKLACAYARAVGQAQVEVAQNRLEEMFGELRGVMDNFATSYYFSVSQLEVVESVVLAVVSDDFSLGTKARRWLDDEEFLVRRRIHNDLSQLMQQH